MFVTKKVTPRIQKILSFSLFPDTFGPSRAPQVRGKACVTVFTRRSLAGQGLVFMMMIKIIFIMMMAMMR